jgi:hypothetical protein
MKVSVFKTNIQYKKQVKQIAPVLNAANIINRWNIDLNDNDKILRIESDKELLKEIETLVQDAGYHCEALTD